MIRPKPKRSMKTTKKRTSRGFWFIFSIGQLLILFLSMHIDPHSIFGQVHPVEMLHSLLPEGVKLLVSSRIMTHQQILDSGHCRQPGRLGRCTVPGFLCQMCLRFQKGCLVVQPVHSFHPGSDGFIEGRIRTKSIGTGNGPWKGKIAIGNEASVFPFPI